MIKVAVCQMCGNGTLAENVAKMTAMIEEAVSQTNGLDAICFPEYCFGVPSQIGVQPLNGSHTKAIASLAQKHHINIFAGSFAEQAENGKAYNTALFLNRNGEIAGTYRKTHLMVALGFDESLDVEPGDRLAVFDTDFGRVGLMVCYDLRFPEVARSMALDGAEIIFVPADFPAGKPLPPRTDHWDIMVKATALQNLTYTVAINQFGEISGEHPFGRSCVIDPWGTVTAQCAGREGIVYAQLDLDYQKQIRASVASWENRRPSLYRL